MLDTDPIGIDRAVKVELQRTDYEISLGGDVLRNSGLWAEGTLPYPPGKINIISNPTVFRLYGSAVVESLTGRGFEVSTHLMRDGEAYKSLRSAERALSTFAKNGLLRTDAVAALGGGVAGDLAGFAASVYLRGISYLQLPTTLLSMIDSSVGGKTGVNTTFGKNLVGTFHQPRGVLIDISTLKTLPVREITAGFGECVKHAALMGMGQMTRTIDFLTAYPVDRFSASFSEPRFRKSLIDLIVRQIEFKAEIVENDEGESATRTDRRARKILNLGHTLAHALEKVTDYSYLRHGEAVAYGILFAAELSKSLALCDKKAVELLNDVVQLVGPLPALSGIDPDKVLETVKLDKKHVSGALQMVLLKDIGKPVIVSEQDLPPTAIRKVLKQFLLKRT